MVDATALANVLPLHTCTPSDSRVFLRGDRQEGSRDERLGATDPPGSRAKRCQGQGLAAGAAARGGQAPRRRLLASRRLRCARPRRRPPRRRRRPRAPSARRLDPRPVTTPTPLAHPSSPRWAHSPPRSEGLGRHPATRSRSWRPMIRFRARLALAVEAGEHLRSTKDAGSAPSYPDARQRRRRAQSPHGRDG